MCAFALLAVAAAVPAPNTQNFVTPRAISTILPQSSAYMLPYSGAYRNAEQYSDGYNAMYNDYRYNSMYNYAQDVSENEPHINEYSMYRSAYEHPYLSHAHDVHTYPYVA